MEHRAGGVDQGWQARKMPASSPSGFILRSLLDLNSSQRSLSEEITLEPLVDDWAILLNVA